MGVPRFAAALFDCSIRRAVFYSVIFLCSLLVWNEFLLYYFHLVVFCPAWPVYNSGHSNHDAPQLNALILSDTHLLGTIKGHWLDKLRREWQMYRSFQSAVTLFAPDVVFILGDIFDEGQWASRQDFANYVRTFHSMFAVPSGSQLYVVTGNHDIGFHYWTKHRGHLAQRFDRHMNTSSVDHLTFHEDILFVRINSIAMENDGCSLCNEAIDRIEKLANHLTALRRKRNKPIYPIVLTHFPLFRPNEAVCTEEDSVSPEEKSVPHRQGLDCFSKGASDYLLDRLKPRLILNGHVHHSCRVNHILKLLENDGGRTVTTEEWTVASFSWRNKVNPSFLMLQVTGAEQHSIRKCFLPNENHVLGLYLVAISTLVLYVLLLCIYKIKSKRD